MLGRLSGLSIWVAIVAAVVVLGLGFGGWALVTNVWSNYETRLRNEGAMACANTVRAAEHDKLKQDYARLMASLQTERERTSRLIAETQELRLASKAAHEEIARVMAEQPQQQVCKIPDQVIDVINRPAKGVPK